MNLAIGSIIAGLPVPNVSLASLDVGQIPSNSFGEFVTVRRYNKLNKFPYDIHGCMGFWQQQYQPVPAVTLAQHILHSAYQAFHVDNRSRAFPDVRNDPLTTVEVDLMLLPLFPISENGMLSTMAKLTTFNNQEYGLIVLSAGGATATFLPGVFPATTPWSSLSRQLLDKAGATGTNAKFYAYKIKQITARIFDAVASPIIQQAIWGRVAGYLNSNSRGGIPFIISKDGSTWSDTKESIRNMGSIYTSLLMHQRMGGLDNKTLLAMKKNVDEQDTDSAQTAAFILLADSRIYSKPTARDQQLCSRLYQSLGTLEHEFALGEVGIALSKACPSPHDLALGKLIGIIKDEYRTASLFQCNWYSKFIAAIYANFVDKNYPGAKHIADLGNLLWTRIRQLVNQGWSNEQEKSQGQNRENGSGVSETNQLAVAFECMCALANVTEIHELGDMINMLRLFLTLQGRINKQGLYAFTDGTARLDITCHVLEALNYL